jgi:Protein of unknown function (DUF2721)
MNVDLANILKVIGPAASIVFAAWIFMGFLQQRYDSAIERYRDAIAKCRNRDGLADERLTNITDQVLVYRHRCDLMSWANLVGLASAMLLILTLIIGEFDTVFPNVPALAYVGAVSAFLGLGLVILAAGLVVREGFITRRQIDSELLDVPDLARLVGREPGAIGAPGRDRAKPNSAKAWSRA